MDGNKRAFPRFLISQPVTYGKPEISVSGSVSGNISLGGISLKVQQFVAIGTVLEIQIALGKSSKLVNLKAEVVRIREVLAEDCFEIGLQFVKDPVSSKIISDYISSLQSPPTPPKE